MELEASLLERAEGWEGLSRWERSELGKDMRRAGLSYSEIMGLVPVKKSTLATWCRDIDLTDKQIADIKVRNPSVPGTPRNTQRKRRRMIELIEAQASLEAIHLQDDPFWTMGVTLYWAEGSKTQRSLQLAHSEPEALRSFVRWCRKFHRSDAVFSAALNLHHNNDEPGARSWWSNQLEIDLDYFTKTFIKPDGTGHRKNHLPNGVARVTMRRSTDAFLTTMVWIDFLRDAYGR
jgi:hypothetical protein